MYFSASQGICGGTKLGGLKLWRGVLGGCRVGERGGERGVATGVLLESNCDSGDSKNMLRVARAQDRSLPFH
jgi:hypothetical protein